MVSTTVTVTHHDINYCDCHTSCYQLLWLTHHDINYCDCHTSWYQLLWLSHIMLSTIVTVTHHAINYCDCHTSCYQLLWLSHIMISTTVTITHHGINYCDCHTSCYQLLWLSHNLPCYLVVSDINLSQQCWAHLFCQCIWHLQQSSTVGGNLWREHISGSNHLHSHLFHVPWNVWFVWYNHPESTCTSLSYSCILYCWRQDVEQLLTMNWETTGVFGCFGQRYCSPEYKTLPIPHSMPLCCILIEISINSCIGWNGMHF